MLSKEAAVKKIQELVKRFEEQFTSYKKLNTGKPWFAKILLILSLSLFIRVTPIAFENHD